MMDPTPHGRDSQAPLQAPGSARPAKVVQITRTAAAFLTWVRTAAGTPRGCVCLRPTSGKPTWSRQESPLFRTFWFGNPVRNPVFGALYPEGPGPGKSGPAKTCCRRAGLILLAAAAACLGWCPGSTASTASSAPPPRRQQHLDGYRHRPRRGQTLTCARRCRSRQRRRWPAPPHQAKSSSVQGMVCGCDYDGPSSGLSSSRSKHSSGSRRSPTTSAR